MREIQVRTRNNVIYFSCPICATYSLCDIHYMSILFSIETENYKKYIINGSSPLRLEAQETRATYTYRYILLIPQLRDFFLSSASMRHDNKTYSRD